MRFGLFGGPRANDRTSSQRRQYAPFIDYVVEAEGLGFESVFIVEHHFTGLGQVSSSLEFLAYLAGRTSTMRLGTAVTVLPWHNPVLLAEQIATLDVVAGGRLDLGVGLGYRPNEFHGFCIDPSEAEARYQECLSVMVKAWTSNERFSHEGLYWRYRDIVVEPRPEQDPHPPIWVGAGSERSIRSAATAGYRLLLDQVADIEQTRRCIEWYEGTRRLTGQDFHPDQVAVTRALMLVTEEGRSSLESEYERRLAGIRMIRESSRIPGDDRPLTAKDHAFYNDARSTAEAAVIAGTPEECIARLKLLEASGAGMVLFSDPSGGIERLRFFADEVMPAFS
jgi:alkanesulfonate monooxygenase SsuD/methylene tetrahydromethanopterin reductase-like flavin-dependent oxidoreductase (luciferase family)